MSTTASTSSTTGALIVDGGVGIAQNLNVGGTIDVTGASNIANTLDVTGDTSVSTFDSSGATSLATGGGVVNVATSGAMTTVKGTLNVDEAVTLDTTLDVTGDTSVSTFDSSGATSLATGSGVVNVASSGAMTTVKGTLNVDEAVTLDTTLDVAGNTAIGGTFDVTGGNITSSTTSSDAYVANDFQSESLLRLRSNDGENNYSGIQFTNSAGSYEMFIGSVQVASSAADIVFQGYDRSAGAYKEYITINDDANTTFAGTVTAGNLLSYGDGTNNNTFIQGRSSAGQYSGIKLARGAGNWSNAENNHFGMVITDNGLELAKFTALGDNATGKAVYMTMADGGNTTFGGTVTATTFIAPSDSRLKSKVQPLNLGLQFINKLSPVSYFKMSRSQYNGEEDNNDLSYEYGLIAQELEEVLKETDPENTVVTKGDDGLLGVSYMQLVMPLIKSVQELSSYVEELESNKSDEIQALKKEIELLKSMIKSQK